MADVVVVKVIKSFGGCGDRNFPVRYGPGERIGVSAQEAACLFRAGLVEPDEDVKGDGNENASTSTN